MGMQVMQPETGPKCAAPGTMAWNLSVLFVLLLAETSPTGSLTGSCSTNWNHWCCWSEHPLLKLHPERKKEERKTLQCEGIDGSEEASAPSLSAPLPVDCI